MHFSRRTPVDLCTNAIAAALAAAPPPFDLTVSNPTTLGLPYPPTLLDALADPAGLVYRPHPRGMAAARRAMAAELARTGILVDPERLVLTASTSEAYAFLFKLLCDPGDVVLVPAPSYPLFEHLARVEGVVAAPYRLDPDAGWRIEFASLDDAGPRVRAVVVVHPNNPTGSFVADADRATLVDRCAARGWALIADEVFRDYPLGVPAAPASFAGETATLTFTLGGLSKSLGLPQLKLAWIVTSGPASLCAEAMERLEYIADTFLSVATPVQLALPALLRQGSAVRDAIRRRCRGNLDALRTAVASQPEVTLHVPEGGWSAVLRIPAVIPEEALVVQLIQQDGVAVYPGYFFDFPAEGFLVVSLLPEPGVFAEGVARLLRRIAASLR